MKQSSTGTSRAMRNIGLVFAGLTALLLAAVAYMAFSSALIVVHLGDVTKSVNFRVAAVEQPLGAAPEKNTLNASFIETSDTASDTFVPATTAAVSGKAGGIVTFHNTTSTAQPLVATTRLLSPGGVLFRLKAPVRVPANGTVTGTVEADQDTAAALIGPSRFTIPGLNVTFQQSIYADSAAPMVRGATSDKIVTADDLSQARESLKRKLLDKARAAIVTQVPSSSLDPRDFLTAISEEKTSAKMGDKVASFTMSLRMGSVAVLFDKAALMRVVSEQAGGLKVSSADSFTYTIVNYDPIDRTVTVSGTTKVASAIDRNSSIFTPANFVGMTPAEVKSFLENYQGIEAVEIKLSPYWQNRLPRIPGRIQVRFE